MGMEQSSVRTTYQYSLVPTPTHEQAVEAVVLRGRTLSTCAVDQRRTWWGRGQGKGATYYQQATEVPDRKAACPDYAEVHSQVLHAVLRRVDTPSQACFGRVAHGETPGTPRLQGQSRSHSFT